VKKIDIWNLTQKEAIRLFRKHWTWLAKTGLNKEDCPPEVIEGIDLYDLDYGCFLCQYDKIHIRDYCTNNCLIKWPGGSCGSAKGPYKEWSDAPLLQTKKELAREIANLPVRKGVRA